MNISRTPRPIVGLFLFVGAVLISQLSACGGSSSPVPPGHVLRYIQVAPVSSTINIGQTQQFAAGGTYADGGTQDLSNQVTWSSSNPAVATISASGLALGLSQGSSTISATFKSSDGTVTGAATLGVAVTLTSLAITPVNPSLAINTSLQLTATGIFSDGSTQDLTASASWSSSSGGVATVNSSGVVTGTGAGSTIITAIQGGMSAATTVTVTSAVLTAITITPPNSAIAQSTSRQLIATGDFSDGTTQNLTAFVTWVSSAPSVAAVGNTAPSQGLVSGSAAGSATISATMGGVSGATAVTVTSAVLTSIVVTPTNPSVAQRSSVQLTATGVFSDGTTQDLTASASWISSANPIATVSSSGLVTGAGVGSATITATQAGVSGTTTVTVTAAVLTAITITPPNSSIAAHTSEQLIATGDFSDGTTQNLTAFVTWASSAPLVAAVSNTAPSQGVVTGSAVGSATISATLAGVSGATTVTVTSAVLTSIAVTPTNPSIAQHSLLQRTATGTFSDGTTQDLTASVSWISSSGTIAPVANTVNPGLVTGTGIGSATITATEAGVSSATTFTVTAAVLTAITITPRNSSIAADSSEQLIATGDFSDGTTQNLTAFVTWVSSAPSLATVSDAPGSQGLLTGIGAGSATITATMGGVSGATTVTVTSAVLTSIAVTPTNPSIAQRSSVQLTATGTFSDGTTQDLTASASWISSSGTIATVANTVNPGLVTGTGIGSATITATSAGVSGTTSVTVTAAVLTAITITPPSSSIAAGTSEQLIATGNFSDGTTQNLTASASWISSADPIATVSSSGLVTGTGTGSATITATQAGVSGTTTVTVTAAVLTAITITPPNSSIAAGTSEQLIATGNFSDGTTQNLTASASWISSADPIATVSSSGLVTGTGTGSATITATQAGVSGTTTVAVTAAVLTAITITPPNFSIAKGTSGQLTANGIFSDSTAQDLTAFVTWASSATSIAAVSNTAGSQGLVLGSGKGSATITATLGGTSDATAVTVTAAVLTAIVVTPSNPSVPNGTTVQLKATGAFSDGTTEDLTTQVSWTSSSNAMATVSGSGLVTGKGVGSSTMTATLAGVSGSAAVTVTAAVLTSLTVTPANTSIPVGTGEQLNATGTFSDGSTEDLTKSVTWGSSDTTLAIVSSATGSEGFVTGTGLGGVTISAVLPMFPGVTGSASVTVTAAILTTIAVTPANPSIANGGMIQLTATGTFSDGSMEKLTSQVSWVSSSEAIAHVDDTPVSPGLVTGTGVGSPTITATLGTVTGGTTVTVVLTPCDVGDSTSVAAYNAIPFNAANCSPPSYSFETTGINELGDGVNLATGTGRSLVSLNVVFGSFACGISGTWNGPNPCVTDPAIPTFQLPITANIYAVQTTGCPQGVTACPGALLATVSPMQTIPFRPSADLVNCPSKPNQWFNPNDITDSVTSPGKCESGIATVLTFNFPSGVTLPDQVIWTVAFDTTHHGANPRGTNPACSGSSAGCPYDSLNVGTKTYSGSPYAGSIIDPTGAFANAIAGFYCDGGAGGAGFLRLDTLPPPGECWTGFTPLGEVITH